MSVETYVRAIDYARSIRKSNRETGWPPSVQIMNAYEAAIEILEARRDEHTKELQEQLEATREALEGLLRVRADENIARARAVLLLLLSSTTDRGADTGSSVRPGVASSESYDHRGFSEEKCVRCGWVMGQPPLNCQNDDTPHHFPSQDAQQRAYWGHVDL